MSMILTFDQLRTVMAAKRYFGDIGAKVGFRSMFKVEGGGMNVGIAMSVGTHHFVVRQHVPSSLAVDDLCALFCGMVCHLDDSHIKDRRATPSKCRDAITNVVSGRSYPRDSERARFHVCYRIETPSVSASRYGKDFASSTSTRPASTRPRRPDEDEVSPQGRAQAASTRRSPMRIWPAYERFAAATNVNLSARD